MSSLGDLFTDIADAIRTKTGEEGTMKPSEFPEKISGISGNSDVVGYVTFMNGEVQLYQMPFIKNFDCPDPHAEGLIDTPTKESTVSTVYSFVGWSTVDGDTDYNASLSGLTEDLTVYAAYEESTRYYTVTFYDEDGTTVLNTMQFGYGQMPSYTPSKSGYTFGGWTTELVPVTGNTSYIVKWRTNVYFSSSSWSDIAAVSEAGEAEQYFKIGDSRTETLTYNGTSYNVIIKIIGFNHDDLVDGTGKAGMTIAFFMFSGDLAPNKLGIWTASETSSSYGSSSLRTYVNSLIQYCSTDLQNVLKSVYKPVSYRATTSHSNLSCKFFPMSVYECGWNATSNFSSMINISDETSRLTGSIYQYFEENSYFGDQNNTNTRVSLCSNTSYYNLGLVSRDVFYNSINNNLKYVGLSNGGVYSMEGSTSTSYYPALAFCV